MRTCIILNPIAGAVKNVAATQERLRRLDAERFCISQQPGDAERFAREASDFDVIVSAGGDGTLNEVVNGIAQTGCNAALAVFPLGTGNDFARTLEARNVRLDVVIPPYSYLVYYEWFDQNRREVVRGQPPLSALLTMRRCLLEAVASSKNVTVYAFDLHPEIVGDMANYRDAVHLNGSEVGRKILSLIDQEDGRLTLENFDAYATTLRQRVASYQYKNSALASEP